MASQERATFAHLSPAPIAAGERRVKQKDFGMEHDWALSDCNRPEPIPAYVGQDRDAASAALGKPASDEQFGLAAGMNEFRIELRNDLPLPANASVKVNERTWAHEDCRLTLWSVERNGKWQVVRGMRWPAGADF